MYARNRLHLMMLAAAMAFTLLFASNAMADDGTGALDFVPEETMMVLSIDIEQLRGTDLFKEAMTALAKEPDAAEALKMLKDGAGFDPEKDLYSVVVAVPPDVEKSENFLMVVKGKFDEKKFVEFAKSEGAEFKSDTHEGMTWYSVDDGALAFAGDYLVVGPPVALKAAIDTHKGKMAAVTKNKSVNGLVKNVDKKSDLWFAVNIPSALQKQMAGENPMMGDIENAHGSIDLGSGLKVRLNVGTKSADTAKSLVDMAQAGLQGAGNDAQLAAMGLDSIVKNLSISNNAKEVEVKLDLNKDEFAKIKQTIQALTGM